MSDLLRARVVKEKTEMFLDEYFKLSGHQFSNIPMLFLHYAKQDVYEFAEQLKSEKKLNITEEELLFRIPGCRKFHSFTMSGLISGLNTFLVNKARVDSAVNARIEEKKLINKTKFHLNILLINLERSG